MQRYLNNWQSTLLAGISASATTAQIAAPDAAKLEPLPAGDHYVITLQADEALEIIHVTAVSGQALTLVRGQEGTAAAAWATGAAVEMRLTAAPLTRFESPSQSGGIAAGGTVENGAEVIFTDFDNRPVGKIYGDEQGMTIESGKTLMLSAASVLFEFPYLGDAQAQTTVQVNSNGSLALVYAGAAMYQVAASFPEGATVSYGSPQHFDLLIDQLFDRANLRLALQVADSGAPLRYYMRLKHVPAQGGAHTLLYSPNFNAAGEMFLEHKQPSMLTFANGDQLRLEVGLWDAGPDLTLDSVELSITQVELSGVPRVMLESSSFVLGAQHINRFVRVDTVLPAQLTIDETVAWPAHSEIYIEQAGVGGVEIISATHSVHVDARYSAATAAQFAVITLKKVAPKAWVVFGNLQVAAA